MSWGVVESGRECCQFWHTAVVTRLNCDGFGGHWISPGRVLSHEMGRHHHVHPSEDAVLTAISRLGGHNSRHSAISSVGEENGGMLLTQTASVK